MIMAISRLKKGFCSKAKVGTVQFRFAQVFDLQTRLFMVVIRLFATVGGFPMVQEIDGFNDSLWQQTAVSGPKTGLLTESKTCDVAIIGAGFTGLNAALDLAKTGHSVCVLEARTLGFGASGRAGGQVNMGLSSGPKDLISRYGQEQAERTIAMMQNTPRTLFERVQKHQLDCDPVQTGWIQSAVDAKVFGEQKALAKEYEAFGGGLEVLGKEELEQRSGANGYVGGLFCPSAGSVQPLSYTRELARVAMAAGAEIFTDSPVKGLTQTGNGWELTIGSALKVKAGQVLVCTNGYTDDLVKGLKEKVVPIRSVLIATEPLSQKLRSEILPNQVTFVDKRRLILYMRYDRDGRLCIGDHGPMRDIFYPSDFEAVKRRAVKVFPQLASVSWDFHWGGRVAMTMSHLPFLYEPKPGLITGMGYNGRGVGMGTVMGINLAKAARARLDDQESTDLDFPFTSPRGYPFHRFHPLGAKIGIAWASLRDHWQENRGSQK